MLAHLKIETSSHIREREREKEDKNKRKRMGESKRCAFTIAAMDKVSSNEHSIYKKRKTTASDTQHSFPDWPEASAHSASTVVSAEFCSDRSCCGSSHVKELHTTKLDPKTKGFETVDSTNNKFKLFSLLSEFSGDSEESTVKSSAVRENRKVKTPLKAEIDEFFAMAEKYEQKWFAEKYNFDIVRDMPLEGRYQWVRLH